ncbi:restriction endonuclease subunit S [Pseudomonas mangrovi]|uniref:Type I restriction endonuclease subunit S n=1 Tax=Pseudomonas mangrovi TaxID=2161748 RepID=A0A2T5PCG3_9PSED|nr:restriction endonuclease subunit S [Pseudomonas mangrovi]PTU75377.1 type I restriction endonuclease subunit S [Pseudomonas mangrovi]
MTFPCYPKYKASGFLWLGDVPEHWTLKRLGHYFEERRERASDTEFEPLSVTKNGIVPRLESAAKTQDGDNRKKVLAGDFVINSRSDRKGSSGLSPLDGSVSLICTVLIPAGLHGPYIHHLFRSELFQEEYYRWGKGIVADLWSTNFSDMKNIVLGVPSEEEQTQIARFLDHETARIDALIEEQQRLIELLKEKRQAVISHAVTKGLDPTVPMKDSGVEWLGEVPAHWVVSRAKLVSDIFVPQRNKPELNDSEGIPWVTMEDMNGGYISATNLKVTELAAREAGSKVLKKGAVIASCVGRFGIVAINAVDVVINQQLQAFEPRKIKAEYLRSIVSLSKEYFELIGTAATLVYVNQQGFENLPVLVPSAGEQESICLYVDEANARFDALLSQSLESIELLQERRSALISAAVTGKIDVRSWQPPASTQAPKLEVAEAN